MTFEESRKRQKTIAEAVKTRQLSVIAAAREFGVSVHVVYRACRYYDVVPHCGGWTKRIRFSTLKVVAALIRGEPASKIAAEVGVTRQRINQIKNDCIEAGIPVKESHNETV